MGAIAIRLEAIAIGLEVIAIWLGRREAIAIRLEANSIRLCKFLAIFSCSTPAAQFLSCNFSCRALFSSDTWRATPTGKADCDQLMPFWQPPGCCCCLQEAVMKMVRISAKPIPLVISQHQSPSESKSVPGTLHEMRSKYRCKKHIKGPRDGNGVCFAVRQLAARVCSPGMHFSSEFLGPRVLQPPTCFLDRSHLQLETHVGGFNWW